MGMFGAKAGSIAGFNPTQPSWIDKIGLIGDILTGNPVTKNRLDEDFAFQQAQYQAQHPNPMSVGGNIVQFDPASGTVKTLYSAPPELDAFGKSLLAAGIDPASPAGQAQYRLKVQNEVDPIHAYPTTDAAGNQGLVFKRPSEMGGVAGQPLTAPSGVTFTPRNGGAAPATGPGGFPLYPIGH